MENKRSFGKGVLCGALAVLIAAGIMAGTYAVSTVKQNEKKVVSAFTEEKLQLIESLIEEYYLYVDEVDEETLQDAIVTGYVGGLDEPYTAYYNKEQMEALIQDTVGSFGGVGVTLMQDVSNMDMIVTEVFDDAPGKAAGIQVGDILYKVNGEDVRGEELDFVITKIRGEEGTDVELTMIRDGKEVTMNVTREIIESVTIEYEMLEDKIGLISISGFEKITPDQFEKALADLTKEGMQGLLIDLRNNPGGNLTAVCDMADMILPEGPIVTVKTRDGEEEAYTSDAEHVLDVPLVVLVNGNSASASEILAGAIQDLGVGTLVGTTTFGKGIVQDILTFTDGSGIKITSSEYFTPSGKNIHGVGITPDVEVERILEEENPESDNQMEKAIEILKEGM